MKNASYAKSMLESALKYEGDMLKSGYDASEYEAIQQDKQRYIAMLYPPQEDTQAVEQAEATDAPKAGQGMGALIPPQDDGEKGVKGNLDGVNLADVGVR